MHSRVTITKEAKFQLRDLPARDQRIIADGVAARLQAEPTRTSRAIKRLQSNPFASHELRLGDLRVLYNVYEQAAEIVIVAVGRKVGNKLIIGGEEFHGHKGNLPE